MAIVNKGMSRISTKGEDTKTMYIGNYNLFEVSAIVDTSDIGSYNVFEAKCKFIR